MANWEDKIKAFLHDPPSKALNIRGHKDISKKFLDKWYVSSGGDEIFDQISASADRPGVPGHGEGCSVDFKETPELTHPISKGRLYLDLANIHVTSMEDNIIRMFDEMEINETEPQRSKFFILFEGLKQNLTRNEPTLYSIWNKIPADTRVPDHSIWHHNSLVSALSACKDEPYFFIFSIGPVHGFISEARKLRDLWVGSMILSYLSWSGMRVICDEFGPDHIIYPSLSGQPLFYSYLKETGLTEVSDTSDNNALKIASFPNKFVAILPKESIEIIQQKIMTAISDDWNKISRSVYESVKMLAGANPNYFEQIWQRQNKNLWEFYWEASPWLKTFQDNLTGVLSDKDIKRARELSMLFEKSSGYPANQGILYQPSHELAQSIFAASKNSRHFHENYREPGDKCTQCGNQQQLSVDEDRTATKGFWKNIADQSGDEIKEHERLCSICLTKRFIYKNPNILPLQLRDVFKGAKFPSSTEMAFDPVIRKLEDKKKISIWSDFITECDGDEKAYDMLHDNDEKNSPDSKVKRFFKRLNDEAHIKITNIFGKYYALLMMDGDKMGDLVNGKSKDLATWRDIMHSSLPEKMEKSLATDKTAGWRGNNRIDEQRHITPSVHKAISEALGDFSLNTVPFVIKKYKGHLIYAGGDDVLAVMPVDTVLRAAQELRELYRTPFLIKRADGSIEKCTDSYTPQKDERLLIHLGDASTISAAVVIAHHKEPLRSLITDAHHILDSEAKEKTGRDAIAISLRKRSGAEKVISMQWENIDGGSFIDIFRKLIEDLTEDKESSKLMYKIDENRIAFEILKEKGLDGSVTKFIESLIEKGKRDKSLNDDEFKKVKAERAQRLNAIMSNKLNTDGLMIARFLAQALGGE